MKLLDLPDIRGTYKIDFDLKSISFLRVGGRCSVLFEPKDEEDLLYFLRNKPLDLMIYCLGNLSNILVKDEGIDGCVILLKNTFNQVNFLEQEVVVGSGVSLSNFITNCARKGIACCEQLYCIPGTVGGAVSMNAGIPGFEIVNVINKLNLLDYSGKHVELLTNDLNMKYRNGNLPKNMLITSAVLKTSPSCSEKIFAEISEIKNKRMSSQPLLERTCGSTFKNPPGMKAWKLIQDAGCKGLSIGGATVSEKHCNFFINKGGAMASDFLELIDIVQNKVEQNTGIKLELEVIVLPK